jgi:hypothetical protein
MPLYNKGRRQHSICLVAGTFDLLHAGHFRLLRAAFRAGARVEIWAADDAMGEAKSAAKAQRLRPFAERAQALAQWCDSQTREVIEAADAAEAGDDEVVGGCEEGGEACSGDLRGQRNEPRVDSIAHLASGGAGVGGAVRGDAPFDSRAGGKAGLRRTEGAAGSLCAAAHGSAGTEIPFSPSSSAPPGGVLAAAPLGAPIGTGGVRNGISNSGNSDGCGLNVGGSVIVRSSDAPKAGVGIGSASFPYRGRYSLHSLPDALGPSISEPLYTAIACSRETLAGCERINAARCAAGLRPMAIFVAPLVLGGSGGKLSSTDLRDEQTTTGAMRGGATLQ